nr:Na-Ca exchanger/integrin-beta4 [uncultured Mediterranean phage uvMED]
MFTVSGKTIQYDRAWTHPDTGVHYPANWLRLTTLAEKQAVGLVEVVNTPSAHDQRFYWSVGNPKQLNDEAVLDESGNDTGEVQTGLKTLWKNTQNEIAATLLAPSDWRVVKVMEVNSSFANAKSALPSTWQTYRAAVRTACNTRQTEIDACATVDALKELLFGSAQIVRTREQQQTDADGNGVVDDDGNPVMETVNDLDDDGNIVMIANPNLATAWPDVPS